VLALGLPLLALRKVCPCGTLARGKAFNFFAHLIHVFYGYSFILDFQFIEISYVYILFTMASNASLPARRLGKDGLQLTAIGIGLMGRSAFYLPNPMKNA
jgi:hypothetical protein